METDTVNKIINNLNKICERIGQTEEDTVPRYKYILGNQDKINFNMDEVENCIAGADLEVKVYEDIDVKDVSRDSKFTIRILNKDGCHVDIDMFAFRDIVLDFEKSEEEFIASKIEKLTGINKDIAKISKAICDYLSVVCYDKNLQIKRYTELGWDYYNGIRIFKYDSIYYDLGYDDGNKNVILGECKNEVADCLRNKQDNNMDFQDWLSDFSLIMSYSDIDALIIATACTGVVRQLLPYTKENNINMNIVGKRASGKSIISHFALSMFGDPTALEGSFTDTDNAVEVVRAERPVLPYILDERMLKVEGKSEDSKRHTLLMDIFREYEGKVKERLAGQGKELSGKRTYGPVISSSVEPMLDKLLEESRDLGQYRRFIELEVTAEQLFNDSRMAESTEEVAYTHYGYGVEMLVSSLIEKMKEDENIVVDTYNEINEIISIILDIVEKKKNLSGMLRSCSRRFALIITTLEFLLGSFVSVKAEYGWIGKNLNEADINKIADIKQNRQWKKSYLGAGVSTYVKNAKDTSKAWKNKSENVLGVLIDNAVKKMGRLNPDIDIYANIIVFISLHRSLFFQENKKWNGKGYIGKLEEDTKKLEIQFKEDRGIEWILVHGSDLSDEKIKECMADMDNKKEVKEKLKNVFGDVVLDDFRGLVMKQEEKGRMEWRDGDTNRGGNNVKLAAIVLYKDNIDTKGMKDSDKTESKTENKKDSKKGE